MQVTSVVSHTGGHPKKEGIAILAALACTFLLFGCEPAIPADDGLLEQRIASLASSTATTLPRPIEVSTGGTVTASIQTVSSGEILHGILSADGDAFLQSTEGSFVVKRGSQEALEIEGSLRWLTHAIPITKPDLLLIDLTGAHVLSGTQALPSPLAESIAPELIHQGIWSNDTLWLIEGDQLLSLADGVLTEVSWPGLLESIESISRGHCVSGTEGLWITGEVGGCLDLADPEWKLHPLISGPVDSFHTTSSEAFYLKEGTLWKHLYGKFWSPIVLPERISQVLSHPEHEIMWVKDTDGWWMLEGATRKLISGIPASFEAQGMDPTGSVQGILAGEWTTIIPGPTLLIKDLAPTDVLYENRYLEFEISPQQEVDLWEVKVDGLVLKADPQPNFLLDISNLGFEEHTIEISAHSGDPTSIYSLSLQFSVKRIPDWKTDIEQIYEEKCSLCHDPGVTTFPLHTAALWKYYIEDIELAVDLDVMPLLPVLPLSEAQKEMIRVWKIYDFPL